MWRVGVSTWCHARLGCQAHPCLDLLDLHPTGLLSALVYAVAAERIFVVDFKSPTFTSLFQPLPIQVSDCMCCVVLCCGVHGVVCIMSCDVVCCSVMGCVVLYCVVWRVV